MLDSLNERLLEVKIQQRNQQKWHSQLVSYKNDLKIKQQELKTLKQQLEKEEEDVEKLSNMGLTYLMTTIFGNREDRLDKEKQELLIVRLKFGELNNAVKQISIAILDLQNKINTLPNVDKIYHEILEEKEQLIKGKKSPLANTYFTLTQQISDRKAQVMEVEEAIHAGEIVINALDQALDSLDSAGDWGTLDLFGGGMITTAIKHNRMDDAQDDILEAQDSMRKFQKELADIELNEDLDIDISGLLTFADYFFDGFITDWLVQGRINEAIENVSDKQGEIKGLLNQLHRNLEIIEGEIEKLTATCTELLENS